MSLNDHLNDIVGKTISRVVTIINNSNPVNQVFLVFDDGTSFELYGDIQNAKGLYNESFVGSYKTDPVLTVRKEYSGKTEPSETVQIKPHAEKQLIAENDNNTQLALLETIYEDVIYIVECMAQNYTGEAKSELINLRDRCDSEFELMPIYRSHITSKASEILKQVYVSIPNSISILISLRRQLLNTILSLKNQNSCYAYAPVIEADKVLQPQYQLFPDPPPVTDDQLGKKMTVREAWIQMCSDFLEDNPEAKGLGYIVDAITGGQGGGPTPKPLAAGSLAKYLERLADGHDTWRQIVALMTDDLEEGELLDSNNLMFLTDLSGSGLTSKYEDS